MQKISKNSIWMFLGIAHYIGHARLLPSVELLQMTEPATLRANKMRWVGALLRNSNLASQRKYRNRTCRKQEFHRVVSG